MTERIMEGGGDIVYFTIIWFISSSPLPLPAAPYGAYLRQIQKISCGTEKWVHSFGFKYLGVMM
jgi:hypothetical protein